MNTLIRDRVKLLRALQKGITTMRGDGKTPFREIDNVVELVRAIRADATTYLSYSQDCEGQVSYATKPEYRMDSMHRTRTTLARFIRRHMAYGADRISDRVLNALCTSVFGTLADAGQYIEIVRGDDIVEAYADEFGGHSCMTGRDSEYTQLYADNEDIVGLLKYRNGMCARALVWYLEDGTVLLDRIYPNEGYHVAAIQEYAKNRGWVLRTHQGMPGARWSTDRHYSVELDHCEGDCLPYADSFHYATRQDANTLRLYTDNRGDFALDSTDGYPETNQDSCYACGASVGEDDTYPSPDGDSIYCDECYSERYGTCNHCYETVARDDLTCIASNHDTVCSDCLPKHYAECESCDEWFVPEGTITTDEGSVHCHDCASANLAQCDGCDTYTDDPDTLTTVSEGSNLCSECVEAKVAETQIILELPSCTTLN